MKLKLSLKGGGIKSFFTAHGEKIALAAAVACLVAFIYSGFKQQPLKVDHRPPKLKYAATQADQHVMNSRFVRDASDVGDDLSRRKERPAVQVSTYDPNGVLRPPIFQPRFKRGDPDVFPPVDLRAAGGVGSFAFAADNVAVGGNAVGGGSVADPKVGPTDREPKPPGGSTPGSNRGRTPVRGPAERRGRPGLPDFNPAPGFAGPLIEGRPLGRPGAPMPGFGPAVPLGQMGAMAPAGSGLQAHSWAVVTGLVPFKKQAAEYDRHFDHAIFKDHQRDAPYYFLPTVERAEVTSDDPKQLKWAPLDLRQAMDTHKWAMQVQEVVNAGFRNTKLTSPLPPLVGAKFDDSVAHPPEIPLMTEGDSAATEGTAPTDGAPAKVEEEEPDFPFGNTPGGPAGPLGPARMGGFEAGPAMPGRPGMPGMTAEESALRDVEYVLLRFFDFTVEPGKRYRYRVQLRMYNPNSQLQAKYLKNPESAAQKDRRTVWSDPTPVVVIPRMEQVFAGIVKAARAVTEPSAMMMLTTFEPHQGFEVSTEVEAVRGSALDHTKDANAVDVRTGTVTKVPGVEFKTGATVLDIRGGKPIPGKDRTLTEPGEVLVLDVEGNLVVRSEVDDEGSYASHVVHELPPENPMGPGGVLGPAGGGLLQMVNPPVGGPAPKGPGPPAKPR